MFHKSCDANLPVMVAFLEPGKYLHKYACEHISRIFLKIKYVTNAKDNLYTKIIIVDGRDFSKFLYYECENPYGTRESLAIALTACREDSECSMIGSSSCDDSSPYYLCGKNTILNNIKNDAACTYRKRSNLRDS